jgi:hypothetical protein
LVPFRYDATGEGVKILKANYGTYFGYFLITKLFDDTLSRDIYMFRPSGISIYLEIRLSRFEYTETYLSSNQRFTQVDCKWLQFW